MGTDPPAQPQSGYAPGFQPQPVLEYQPPSPSQRPTTVTVLAIIGLIIGSSSLLINAAWVVGVLPDLIKPATGTAWPAIESSISSSFAIVLVGLCVGCLRATPAARRGVRVWAGAYIGWLGVCAAALLTWGAPMLDPKIDSESAIFGQFASIGVGLVVLGLISIYPILALKLMSEPPTIATSGGEAH